MQNTILLEVKDDSMSMDRINKGDKVSVKKDLCFDENDIVAILHNSNVIFRRLKKIKDGFMLIPSNLQYPVETITNVMLVGIVNRVYIRQ